MDITIKLDLKDWYSFQKYLEREIPRTNSAWSNSFLFNVVVWVVLGFAFASLFQGAVSFHWPTAAVVALVFAVLIFVFFINLNKYKHACAPSEGGVFLREQRFVFSDEGISSFGKEYEGKHGWSLVNRVVRANGSVMLFLDSAYAYVFPEHKLKNPDEFYSYVSSRVQVI